MTQEEFLALPIGALVRHPGRHMYYVVTYRGKESTAFTMLRRIRPDMYHTIPRDRRPFGTWYGWDDARRVA